MNEIVVAVPSTAPGGLAAELEEHFGHSEVFTLVTLRDGAVAGVEVAPGMEHHEGGCVEIVSYLAGKGINVLVAGGMGMRPLMAFDQSNIAVFHCGDSADVRSAVEALAAGRLARFDPAATCHGH
jgi:predicted Fe-Mo cluster-binding NifX family protein